MSRIDETRPFIPVRIAVLTVSDYLSLVLANIDPMVEICTHPKEDKNTRREGLVKGIKKLGIAQPVPRR